MLVLDCPTNPRGQPAVNVRSTSLFVVGALFAVGAVQTCRNADECRAIRERDGKPTSITAADLAAHGPGQARYLSITDYELERKDIVLTKWKRADGFIGASLLVRPKGRPPAAGQPRVVVLISAKTDADIARYLRKTGPIVGCVR